jgi:hypothetical protein
VELGLEVDRTVINLGGGRQVWYYPNIILVHVTYTASMHVSKALVPNDAKGLTSQGVDLPSDAFTRVLEDGDWRSRGNGRRRQVALVLAQQVQGGGDQEARKFNRYSHTIEEESTVLFLEPYQLQHFVISAGKLLWIR